jgi:hypothetical protein
LLSDICQNLYKSPSEKRLLQFLLSVIFKKSYPQINNTLLNSLPRQTHINTNTPLNSLPRQTHINLLSFFNPPSPTTLDKELWGYAGYEMGFDRLCWPKVRRRDPFFNPLLSRSLSSFLFFEIWVCFAFFKYLAARLGQGPLFRTIEATSRGFKKPSPGYVPSTFHKTEYF